MTAVWLAAGLLALLYAAGSRRGVPAVDLVAHAPAIRGTITGLVHGPGDAPLPGRTVEVVDVASGQMHRATTALNGGFVIQVPRGRYRLEVQLRDGETLTSHPAIVNVDRADTGSRIELGVAAAGGVRHPSYRLDNGLGSPMA